MLLLMFCKKEESKRITELANSYAFGLRYLNPELSLIDVECKLRDKFYTEWKPKYLDHKEIEHIIKNALNHCPK